MTIFWLLAVVLFAISIAAILYPFLFRSESQKAGSTAAIDQKQVNVDIAREQLTVLESNLSSGDISQEEYDALKYEIESSLIEDIAVDQEQGDDNPAADPVVSTFGNKMIMVSIMIFVPIFSVLLYQKLGSPDLIDMSAAQAKQTVQHDQVGAADQPSVDEMIAALAAKMEETPGDVKGWQLLARSYMTLKRYAEAYKVYSNLLSLQGENATILVSMADSLSMARGGSVVGEPERLLRRALELSPENIAALWLVGIAERDKGNSQQALVHWNKLYPLIENAEDKQRVAQLIQSVGGSVAGPGSTVSIEPAPVPTPTPVAAANAVKVTVSIDAELMSQANPGDMVFIYAKAQQGPPMPLAAVKKKVADLPVTVFLDDSQAMMPTMKMSSFGKVKIGARISRSGQPIRQAGDLMSEEINVDLSNIQPVTLNINSVVK